MDVDSENCAICDELCKTNSNGEEDKMITIKKTGITNLIAQSKKLKDNKHILWTNSTSLCIHPSKYCLWKYFNSCL